MTDDLVKRLRTMAGIGWNPIGDEAASRIEELEAALREKDNIAFIIDSHGIAHKTFTVIYTGEKTND